jgi:hypothetical protein
MQKLAAALVLLVFAVVVAGCGSPDDGDDATVTVEPPSVAVPSPTVEPTVPASTVITWDEAVALIEACRVRVAGQTHARNVYLTLDDGSERETVQPVLDDLFSVVGASGCQDQMQVWTE